MKNGETGEFNDFHVTRVPGGWIFHKPPTYINTSATTIFVPFNNEFMD